MTSYINFIGIDIGKFSFVAFHHGSKKSVEFQNDKEGHKLFIEQFKNELPTALCVLEVTGGYERALLIDLCNQGYNVHRANTCMVKNFIRSYGNDAKTDNLDARALSRYGLERYKTLKLFIPPSKQLELLSSLVQRRLDLISMMIAEKNRAQSPCHLDVKKSCNSMVKTISKEIDDITNTIDQIIKEDSTLNSKNKILQTIPGIGKISSMNLLILLPELGTLNRRQIASLAGLAPKSNDSGKLSGYRKVRPGREQVKPTLYMAAMAASRSNSNLKAFYLRLVDSGKKKKVALVALMRKIVVIANAKIKDESNQAST